MPIFWSSSIEAPDLRGRLFTARQIIRELYDIKSSIVTLTGLPESLLHVLIGLLIYLLALCLLKSPRSAFAVVLTVQLLNEVNDFLVKEEPLLYLVYTSIVDTAATTLLPLAIGIFAARWRLSRASQVRAIAQDRTT